jgi:hypothetical protein
VTGLIRTPFDEPERVRDRLTFPALRAAYLRGWEDAMAQPEIIPALDAWRAQNPDVRRVTIGSAWRVGRIVLRVAAVQPGRVETFVKFDNGSIFRESVVLRYFREAPGE